MSVRWKLTLSYAGVVLLSGLLLLAVVWLFLLRYVPDGQIDTTSGFVPNRADLVRAFRPAVLGALAFLLVFGLAGGWVLAGRMLAPLTRITDATRVAADGALSHRIRLEGRRDELRELADAFDAMLARLEAHVAEQQRFAANASHELRTPLAITQAILDVARSDPDRDAGADLDRLKDVNSRAIALADALLLLSRAGEAQIPRDPVDLSLLAEEAAETLLPLAERNDIEIDVSGSPAMTRGESVLLSQMVANLVQNAIIHNLDAGGEIRVKTTQEQETASLLVENTGEEIPQQRIASLTEPFQRGADRARNRDHAGAGLGLAIVERIAHTHGGSVSLAARDGGGLRVRIDLPAA